ncbi:MAG: hypothetical protein WDN28_09580 [Chthoniobacter sp.]
MPLAKWSMGTIVLRDASFCSLASSKSSNPKLLSGAPKSTRMCPGGIDGNVKLFPRYQ